MLAFIIRRAVQAVLVIIVVALIAFTLFRFVGDPINQMVGIETSAAEREALREQLATHQIVTVHLPTKAGQTLTIRKGTTPEPRHKEIYQTLGITDSLMTPVKQWVSR